MTTEIAATSAAPDNSRAGDGSPSGDATATPTTASGRHRRPSAMLVVALILAVPLVAGAVYALTHHWYPTSDVALIELRTWDTGSPLTPVVGPFSRLGWNHPGPLLFWALAVPYRLTGASSGGLLLGALLINGASILGCLAIARRLGGGALLLITGLALAMLMRGLGASFLFSVWNPDLPVFPLVFLAMATWAVIEGRLAWLPAAALASCFAWQSHLGNAPVAGYLLGVAVVAFLAQGWRPRTDGRGRDRRWWGIGLATAIVLAASLTPLAIDQLRHDPSNLELIVESFRNPPAPAIGLGRALAIGSLHFAPNGTWLSGHDPGGLFTGEVDGLTPWALVPTLVLIGVAAALAVRAGRRRELRLLALTSTTSVIAVFAVSRTTGEAYPYLFNGLRSVAAVLAIAAVWAIARSLPFGITAPGDDAAIDGRPSPLRRPVPILVVLAILVLSVASIFSQHGLVLPNAELSATVAEFEQPVVDAVGDGSVFIDPAGTWCSIDITNGLDLQLIKRGTTVRAPELLRSSYGSGRVDGPPADVKLRVLCGTDVRDETLRSSTPPLVARDMLPSAESAELSALQDDFRAQLRAAHREDLLPMVDNGSLVFAPLATIPGFTVDRPRLLRFAELFQAQQRAIAVYRD